MTVATFRSVPGRDRRGGGGREEEGGEAAARAEGAAVYSVIEAIIKHPSRTWLMGSDCARYRIRYKMS